MIYGNKINPGQYDGDCIIEVNDITYVGRLKPGYPRSNGSDPVEQQAVWQIERIDCIETTQTVTVDEQEVEVTTYKTRRMYPQGNEDYKFRMSEAEQHTYEYRH